MTNLPLFLLPPPYAAAGQLWYASAFHVDQQSPQSGGMELALLMFLYIKLEQQY